MKATLSFNLDDYEDRKAHKRCMIADDMAVALWDVSQIPHKFKHYDESEITLDVIRSAIMEALANICIEDVE